MGRPDGTLVKGLPKYRRMMPFMLRTKNESLVQSEVLIKAEEGVRFAERMSVEYGMKVTYFHLLLHSLFKTFVAYPEINRFIAGRRLYQRKGIWFTFSVKKEVEGKASLSIVKREFKPDFSLEDTINAARKDTKKGRSKRPDAAEKEAGGYLFLPRFVIVLGFPFYLLVDYFGLFTDSYIRKEPLWTSVFLANVGIFGVDSTYHHLYEVGNCPIFISIGKIEDRVVAEDGKPVVRKVLPLKVNVDERVNDGFYFFNALHYFKDNLEHPERLLELPERVG